MLGDVKHEEGRQLGDILPVFLKAKGKDRTPAPIAELHKVATEGNAALWMGASWLVSASWRSSSGGGGPVKAEMMILARCPVEVSTSRTSSSSRGSSVNPDIQTMSEDKGR